MSSSTSMLLPCCTQCSAVTEKESWFKSDGTVTKTTQKLSACARCHLDRYCSRQCQKKHWSTHKVRCVPSAKVITGTEVDKIVKQVFGYQSARVTQYGRVELFLDSKNKFLSTEEFPKKAEAEEERKLCVDVKIEEQVVGRYTYLLCLLEDWKKGFDWKSRVETILNPPNGIHNDYALVKLGHEMLKKQLYTEAFLMIADKTPEHSRRCLQDMFFPSAVTIMHAQKVNFELIVSCAEMLQKNRVEVEVLIHPFPKIKLPKDLQSNIETAQKLPYGSRDVKMVELAQEIAALDLYDPAFDLVFHWVIYDCAKIIFFRSVVEKMISQEIAPEKIVQLAKKIKLSDAQILNEIVGIYAVNGQTEFTCQLAQHVKHDYHLELIFTVLNKIKGRKSEEMTILDEEMTSFDIVSEYKMPFGERWKSS